jgi:3-hydroxybutyryl-CoA dehydrogenase
MKLVVLSDDTSKNELLDGAINGADITWIRRVDELRQQEKADGYLDLLFDASEERIGILRNLSPKPIIINAVVPTLKEMKAPFVRLNAWAGFLNRPLAEVACGDENRKIEAEKIFSLLNKKTRWVADKPGFISARIIAQIVNEAYFALEEGVSTKKEIDIAMKLGTNYPFGPFEWCSKIGISNVFALLSKLSKTNQRYKPAELLAQEALA